VTDAEFWPQIMTRCTQEWPDLANQPGIPRLLSGFNSKTMSFSEEIPEDINEI